MPQGVGAFAAIERGDRAAVSKRVPHRLPGNRGNRTRRTVQARSVVFHTLRTKGSALPPSTGERCTRYRKSSRAGSHVTRHASDGHVFVTAPQCACSRARHGAGDPLRSGVSHRSRPATSAASLAASARDPPADSRRIASRSAGRRLCACHWVAFTGSWLATRSWPTTNPALQEISLHKLTNLPKNKLGAID